MTMTIAPEVFKVPTSKRDESLVALMMPFNTIYNTVGDVIKEAATSLSLDCKRVDDIWEDSTIIQDVFNLIFASAFVVCDFSERNSNVFYEAGIAHTLGRTVIPIVQDIRDIPSDLKQHRAIRYLPNNEGLLKLKTEITKRMEYLKAKIQPAIKPKGRNRRKVYQGETTNGN